MYTMKIALTKRQARILAFLKKYLHEKGYPPTVREIAAHFRISSPRGAKKHLYALEVKGYIQKRPGSARAIELRGGPPGATTPASDGQSLMLPILGGVRAGVPNLATQEIIGHLTLDTSLTRDPNAFALRIQGDSMVEAGILDGDYVVVKPQATAANGDIVVALVESVSGVEATVKRFFKEKDKVRLQPANSRLQPMIISNPSEGFRVLGKVVCVVRKL